MTTTAGSIASSILSGLESEGETVLKGLESAALTDAVAILSTVAPIVLGIPGDEITILKNSYAAGVAALKNGETYGEALAAAYDVFYNSEKTEFQTVTVKLLDAFLAGIDPAASGTQTMAAPAV